MSLVTIAIPTYNRENELKNCLSSICKQLDNLNHEVDILVSDNASNYDIRNVVLEYIKLGYPIKLNINKKNVGMTKNFMYCLSEAKGEYVWLFSDDEYMNDNKLYEIIKIIKENKPDLIFINNSRVKKNRKDETMDYFSYKKDVYIKKVGVYSTLITSNIFKRNTIEEFLNAEYDTLFPHFCIYYNVIRKYSNLAIIDGDIFTTTPGNSSGYKWFETFVCDLSGILNSNKDIISEENRKYLDNQLLKYLYFKQFLNVGMGNCKKKRDVLENFPEEDFKSIYIMIKTRFSKRINFWVYIFTVYKIPKKMRILIYNFIVNIVMPIYRKKY